MAKMRRVFCMLWMKDPGEYRQFFDFNFQLTSDRERKKKSKCDECKCANVLVGNLGGVYYYSSQIVCNFIYAHFVEFMNNEREEAHFTHMHAYNVYTRHALVSVSCNFFLFFATHSLIMLSFTFCIAHILLMVFRSSCDDGDNGNNAKVYAYICTDNEVSVKVLFHSDPAI